MFKNKLFLIFIMFKLIKKYHSYFDLHNSRGIKKIFNGFMLTLLHILTCFILIFLFPEQWIGILIVGLILPDLSYFFHMFIHPAAMFKEDFNLKDVGTHRKKLAHLLTFIVVLFLLMTEEYVLFLAGGIHLILDLLGF